MRDLTIKRHKSFVGCLAKFKVYIEDPASRELTIAGVPCRKLGELKNGQEQTFQIGTEETRLFVISDKFSKDYSNEYLTIPAGQEAVTLAGGSKYDPARGNAFRFDGNDSAQIIDHRKKGSRTGWIILAVAAVVGMVLGFVTTSWILDAPPAPKTFTSNGMTVTLTEDFRQTAYEGFTVCFETPDVAVFARRGPEAPADSYDLEQQGKVLLAYTGIDAPLSKTEDGLIYFEHEATIESTDYHYIAFLYQAPDALWTVEFATSVADHEAYAQQIFQWARSVSFGDR